MHERLNGLQSLYWVILQSSGKVWVLLDLLQHKLGAICRGDNGCIGLDQVGLQLLLSIQVAAELLLKDDLQTLQFQIIGYLVLSRVSSWPSQFRLEWSQIDGLQSLNASCHVLAIIKVLLNVGHQDLFCRLKSGIFGSTIMVCLWCKLVLFLKGCGAFVLAVVEPALALASVGRTTSLFLEMLAHGSMWCTGSSYRLLVLKMGLTELKMSPLGRKCVGVLVPLYRRYYHCLGDGLGDDGVYLHQYLPKNRK